MKKVFESKKVKLILTGIVLLVVTIGTSYAWWTASVETKQEISMGNLKIAGNFPEIIDIDSYEPGLTIEIPGEITNTGSIEAMIRIENSSQIKLTYSDNEGTVIPEDDRIFEPDNEQAVKLMLEPQEVGSGAMWFNDKKTNDIYLLLEIDGTAEVAVVAKLDGDVMDNKYMDAGIQLGTKIQATQVLEGSLLAEFNVTVDDLELISRTRSATAGKARLAELIERGN